jgi:hypothetical protein
MGYTGKKPATSAQIDSSADIVDGVIQSQDIQTLDAAKLTGTVVTARLGTGTADSTKFLRGDNTWQVVAVPKLDLPVITGTLSVLSGGTVSHTVANWSDDVSYTIVPTNCTVGAVNSSGVFVVTSTSGLPSYTIKATTASLGLDDSDIVTKNIALQLTAPTISSPADSYETVDVTYTITSTTTDDDKLILNIGSSNFTYQSVSVGTASKVGNTVECVGFTTNNPAVIIQYTAEATYSVTATSVKIDGTLTTSPASSADSITILNPTLGTPAISSPADVGTLTNAAYTITSNDANDNKLILNVGSSNFNFGSVSVGSASKVGNTVECTGFTTNNPVVTIQYTAEATYSVTAQAIDTTGYYHDSASSGADSIIIANFVGMTATGGQSTVTIGDYKAHIFTTSGSQTFNITTLGDIATIDYLILAGGGAGGGGYQAGGGGAGGYRNSYGGEASGRGNSGGETAASVTQSAYTVVVGAGGSAGTSNGGNGANSSISGSGVSLTSNGGGGGGTYNGTATGANGGSGGGAGDNSGNDYGGDGTTNQGYDGGDAIGYASPWPGGGGGGAGGNGQHGGTTGTGSPHGGIGLTSNITNSSTSRGGGGGGGSGSGNTSNGTSGGGNGAISNSGTPTAGAANYGGGGGGAYFSTVSGANGGSGIVVIRYKFQ